MSARVPRFACERCGNEPHGGVLYLLYEHHGAWDDGLPDPVARACAAAAAWIAGAGGGERLPEADGLIRLRVDGQVVLIQPDEALGTAYLSGESADADLAVQGVAQGLRGRVARA